MADNDVLLFEVRHGVAWVTLNRPRVLNALSRLLRAELVRAFEQVDRDPAIGVAIITGAGRAFCAGLDLKELGGSPTEETQAAVSERDVVAVMERCRKPIIGAINGFAITGGFELALACDILIASSEARFADTHARVGIMPGWGLSQKLSRLVGIYRAKELSLTGNFIDAQTAFEWGLVNRVVEPSQLLSTCEKIARDILSCDQELVRAYKNLIDSGFSLTYAAGRALESNCSRAFSRKLSTSEIENRRRAVLDRGRSQLS
ncbi:MAG: enoyl-CoA hydratase [Candidatus Binatia bacterium]|nr:enoyl-CoA hydratase [Candidatus Binatia bacterium]